MNLVLYRGVGETDIPTTGLLAGIDMRDKTLYLYELVNQSVVNTYIRETQHVKRNSTNTKTTGRWKNTREIRQTRQYTPTQYMAVKKVGETRKANT